MMIMTVHDSSSDYNSILGFADMDALLLRRLRIALALGRFGFSRTNPTLGTCSRRREMTPFVKHVSRITEQKVIDGDSWNEE
jgi:hypothetical protein